MPLIDYSKWDNIDTDSESENVAPCAPSKPASKPTAAPAMTPKASSTTATTTISPRPRAAPSKRLSSAVVATKVSHGKPRTSPQTTPSSTILYHPVPALLEFPVVIHRVGTQANGTFGCLDYQPITYIHAEPVSCLALPQWQSGIGTVIVARRTRRICRPSTTRGSGCT
ncbi:uncharacterized protein BO97DRAFT_480350 [Aspergillus homomorphus CBS 101889]|uniref:Uncharacterized protein n=1 Tax=Aspergillus homomorphus (strain CBS 101889) TaxID=1450537 RepID=A0A395HPP3_ASPHC|nr:hypothetical protein BO97DRAFT_480350 [Aspergillus homomorphus CBS 101889]RAL08828.1 hypothetical protein BO97DRAFT_480350 [Aspergillus homomorphus CBS 101889]